MMEWRKDAWRDMNSKLFNFYDKYMGKLRLESTLNKKEITSSNTNAIEVDKNSTLPEGTHTINSVDQLAEAAVVKTNAIEVNKKDKDGNVVMGTDNNPIKVLATKESTLEDLGITTSANITMSINGGKFTITKDSKIKDIESAMKKAAPDLNINFDEGAGAFC